jgi:hypothetical protein
MKDVRPEDLIAAWAHDPDALDDGERAAAEARCAEDPAAAAEAAAARALLDDVRALPEPEPPAALGRAIAEAVDRAAASRWGRLRAWLGRPRVAVPLAAAAAAAIALAVIAARSGGGTAAAPGEASAAPTAPAPARAPASLFGDEPATAGELADLDALDDGALTRLATGLDDDGDGAAADAWAPFAGADDDDLELSPPAAAEVATGADDDDLGLWPDPDLGWVDQLSTTDVDSLDRWLDQHRSPT